MGTTAIARGALESLIAALLLFLVTIAIGCATSPRRAKPPPPASQLTPQMVQLVQELKSSDPRRRTDAAIAMEKIKPLPPEAIDALAEAAQSADPRDPYALLPFNALSTAGAPALTALAKLARNSDRTTCDRAVRALHPISMHEQSAATILIDSFKACPASHGMAAVELAQMGPSVIPTLRERLKDSDPRIRAGAAESLGLMKLVTPDFPGMVPNVVAVAKPDDLAPAVPDLAEALNDTDANVRYRAAIALASIDPTDKRAVPMLLEAFEGEDIVLAQNAFYPLEKMGANASTAAPALRQDLAHNPKPLMRALAAQALGAIEGRAACPTLEQALSHDSSEKARSGITVAMVKVSPACPGALPALIANLGQNQPWALSYLANLGEPAIPALSKALKNPDVEVRKDAVQALAMMHRGSPQAMHALELALKDVSLQVRSIAASALEDQGVDAGKVAHAKLEREREVEARRAKADPTRYTKAHIVAPIPADADHKYPLVLAYLIPVGGPAESPEFLITLDTGKQRPERLTFWKRAGDDRYQRLRIVEPEGPDFAQQHFGTPITFSAHMPGALPMLLVDVPQEVWRGRFDRVFVFDGDEVKPVEIESPEEWYQGRLGPEETVRHPGGNSFSNNAIGFSFAIWKPGDPECCPTGGSVTGTYDLVQQAAGGGFAMPIYDSSGAVVGLKSRPLRLEPSNTVWKLVPTRAHREPAPATPTSALGPK